MSGAFEQCGANAFAGVMQCVNSELEMFHVEHFGERRSEQNG